MSFRQSQDDTLSPLTLAAAVTLVDEVERLEAEVDRLKARVKELDRLAHTDSLVLLANRRSFYAALNRVIARVDRYGEVAAVIFVDVDGLKQINDEYGHQAGDRALVAIAEVLAASVRKSDLVARLSGDEFAILLPYTDELTAWTLALRIVEAVAATDFRFAGRVLPLSVATGAGELQPHDTPEAAISRADQAMYRIKVK